MTIREAVFQAIAMTNGIPVENVTDDTIVVFLDRESIKNFARHTGSRVNGAFIEFSWKDNKKPVRYFVKLYESLHTAIQSGNL